MASSRHFRISPLAFLAILAAGSVIGFAQEGYFKRAFHQDILATINPADVLTPADMLPQRPKATPTTEADDTRL
jgi:hypothetical protein